MAVPIGMRFPTLVFKESVWSDLNGEIIFGLTDWIAIFIPFPSAEVGQALFRVLIR